MNYRTLTAQLVGCKPEELLALKIDAHRGTFAVAPNGRKFHFTIDDLLAQALKNAKEVATRPQPAAIPVARSLRISQRKKK